MRAKEEETRKAFQQKQFRKQRQEQAQRIRKLTDELGLIDDCPLPSQYSWKEGMTVEKIERIADGRFGDDYYYDGNILPTDTAMLMKWAEFLECSTDYLLGLSEDPTPAAERKTVSEPDTLTAEWKTGTPTEVGDYVVVAGCSLKETAGCTTKTIKHWNGTEFVDEKTNVRFDLTVYRWLMLPEV